MNSLFGLTAAGLAGLVLGGVFYGGLWWTVRRGLASPRAGLIFVGSFVLRTGIVLAGFYLIGQEDWQRLAPCLLGFVAARIGVSRLAPAPCEPPEMDEIEDGRHAP